MLDLVKAATAKSSDADTPGFAKEGKKKSKDNDKPAKSMGQRVSDAYNFASNNFSSLLGVFFVVALFGMKAMEEGFSSVKGEEGLNPYSVLEVSRFSSQADIKKAYKKL